MSCDHHARPEIDPAAAVTGQEDQHAGHGKAAGDIGQILRRHTAGRLGARRKVLVAFSGGLDSTVLLDILVALRDHDMSSLALRAVYIHHGLSDHADQWAEHCLEQCRCRRVPFQAIPVQVSPAAAGIEAAAREARYQALRQVLSPEETLVTAQHLDDQSETFLLALKRGSGPAGLSAMAPLMSFHGHELLRPLLEFSRAQLTDYARNRGLSWIEDESNQNDRFDRNFLRLRVLPVLNQRWPHFSRSVARSARLCAEQEALLDELLQETLAQLTGEDGSLALPPMLSMSASRRGAVLRRWLAAAGMRMPSSEQLELIWREVALSRPDAEPQYQLACRVVRRYRGRLYLVPLQPSLRETILPWPDISRPLVLPEKLGMLCRAASGSAIRAAGPDEHITVRFSAAGRQHIVGRAQGREMKKIWQELGIAPWRRERTPLVFYNDRLITAPGIFVTREGEATEAASSWYIDWRSAENGNGQD